MKTIKRIINDQSQLFNKRIIAIDEILSSIFYDQPNKLTENEKAFVYIENLEREVNNGGFYQFFFNSAGDYTQETLKALRLIGANKTASLLEKAIKQFPELNVPRERDKRQHIIRKIENKAKDVWNELDNKFYTYEDNISELLLKFITNNIDDFRH